MILEYDKHYTIKGNVIKNSEFLLQHRLNDDIMEWLKKYDIKYRTHPEEVQPGKARKFVITFEDPEDAMRFKLTWL
jgi:hypothetical protein